jgi:DNA-binding transcriptional MerR regulator
MAESLNVTQLVEEAGISQRTLRYWIRRRLVPRPHGRGRAAKYTVEHLNRLRVVKYLRSTKLSLVKIRALIAEKSDAELLALVPQQVPRSPGGVPEPPPEPVYPHENWQMIELMNGLVLLVRPDCGVLLRRIAREIYEHYRLSV